MKIRRWHLITLAAAAGLACGFVFRRVRYQNEVSKLSESAAGASGFNGRESRALPLAVTVKEELAVSSGVARWLVWMRAVERAGLTDLPALARMANQDAAALRMISAKWLALDANHLLETIGTEKKGGPETAPWYELGFILIEDWMQRDAAGAVAALSRKGLPPALYYLRSTILMKLVPGQPELALRAASEWEKGEPEAYYNADIRFTTEWIKADPRHAAEFALDHPSNSTERAMEEITKIWSNSDPEGALAFAVSLKDAARIQAGNKLIAATLKNWSAEHPDKAAAWLAGADQTVRNRFSGPVVETWAAKDAQASLDWIEDHLAGRFRDDALARAATGMANKDMQSAVALVNELEPSQARNRAAAAVAKKWFPSSPKSKRAVPPEAVTWLASLDAEALSTALDGVQVTWAAKDPQGMAAFLLTPEGGQAPEGAFAAAAWGLSRGDPAAALEWAGRVPEEWRQGAVVSALSSWQAAQPGPAAEWVRKLPADDPRREWYFLAAMKQSTSDEAVMATAVKSLMSAGAEEMRGIVERLGLHKEVQQSLMQRLQVK